MATDSVKVGGAYIEVRAKRDKLKDDLEKARRDVERSAKKLENELKNIRLKMDTRLAQLKMQDVEKLHAKLKKRLEEKIKLNFDTHSIRKTKAQLESVEKVIRDISNKSGKGGAGFFSGTTGITKAGLISAAVIMTKLSADSIKLAANVEGVRAAFDRLDHPNLLNKLRKAVRNTIDDFTLMKVAMRAHNFKIPLDSLATYLEFAQKRATQTGEAVDYLVNSIVDGIGRKSSLVLDNLGISAAELQEEIKKTGDFGRAAANIVSRGLKEMGDVALTTKDGLAQINALLENIKIKFGDFLIGTFEGLKTAVKIQLSIDTGNFDEFLASQKADEINQRLKNLKSSYAEATKEARKLAKTEATGKTAEEIKQLINSAKAQLEALKAIDPESSLANVTNDIEQINAKIETYENILQNITLIWDYHGKTYGEIENRIEFLKEKIKSLVPGSKEAVKAIEELTKLQNIISPKSKKTTNIKIDFEQEMIDDMNELDALIEKENELESRRRENLAEYASAKEELDEKERKRAEQKKQEEIELHTLRMSAISEFGNALEALGSHSKTFVAYLNAALQTALRIVDALDTINGSNGKTKDTFTGILGIASGIAGFVGAFLKEGGTVTNYGGGRANVQPYKKFASGTAGFIVPSGFNKDDYIVGVSSGEKITVTPAGAVGQQEKLLFQINQQIGALNANTVEYLSELVNVSVNRALEAQLAGTDIVISERRASKIMGRYQ